MNEQTSTTPAPAAESTALDLVRQAAQRGRERLEADAAIAAQQTADQAARDAERWPHVYHTLGLAEWMLPFVGQPEPQRRPDDCMVLLLNLPACAPIIFARTHTAHLWSTATCASMIPVALEYDPDGERWYVRRRQGKAYVLRLLDLAIAEAEHHGCAWAELHLEATRRNDRGERPSPWQPSPPPAPVEVEMPDDPAAKVLAHIAELNFSSDDLAVGLRGLLYGAITIAKELRGLRVELAATRAEIAAARDAVEDLAAIRVAVEDLAAAALCDELADASAEQDSDNVN